MRLKQTLLAIFALVTTQNVFAQTIDTSDNVSADLVAWEMCTGDVRTFVTAHAGRLPSTAQSIISAEAKQTDSIEILSRSPYRFKVRTFISVNYITESKEVSTLGSKLYTFAEIKDGVCKVSF